MSMYARAARCFGIVEMNRSESIATNDPIEFAKCFLNAGRVPDVVARCEQMRGVYANTKPFPFAHIGNDVGDLFEAVPEAGALTGGRFKRDLRFHFRNFPEHAIDGIHNFLKPSFFARAEVGSGMQN